MESTSVKIENSLESASLSDRKFTSVDNSASADMSASVDNSTSVDISASISSLVYGFPSSNSGYSSPVGHSPSFCSESCQISRIISNISFVNSYLSCDSNSRSSPRTSIRNSQPINNILISSYNSQIITVIVSTSSIYDNM